MAQLIAAARRIAAPLIVSLTASLPARAGNDDEIFVGNQAAMAGVSATVSDSSATWYNPAATSARGGRASADTLSLSTTLALRDAFWRARLNALLAPADIGNLGAPPGRMYVHELGL